MDGASSSMGSDAGIVIITLEGVWLEHSFRLGFKASNNETEYEALLVRMRTVLDMDASDVEFYSNSRLVVSQVQGRFEALDSRMKQYLQVVKQVMNKFHTASVAQIPRRQNRHADSLTTLASLVTKDISRLIKVELLGERSIDIAVGVDVTMVSPAEWCWMDLIINFLAEDRVPDDEKEANKVRRTATRY